MNFKDGVFLLVSVVQKGVEKRISPSPQIRAAWLICDAISKRITGKEITITSVLDGRHKKGSKHYIGDASDLRTFIYTKEQIPQLEAEFKKELGPDYDVIFEGDHFHIEYDPKK